MANLENYSNKILFPSIKMFFLGGNFGCPSLKLYILVYPNAGCTHCSAFHYDNGLGERASTQEAMQLVRKKAFRGSTTVGST